MWLGPQGPTEADVSVLQAAEGLQPGGHTLEAVDVSQDHKPKDPSEERRIKACGGRVDRLIASECPGAVWGPERGPSLLVAAV